MKGWREAAETAGARPAPRGDAGNRIIDPEFGGGRGGEVDWCVVVTTSTRGVGGGEEVIARAAQYAATDAESWVDLPAIILK